MEITKTIDDLKQRYNTVNPFDLCELLNIRVRYVEFLDNPRGHYTNVLGDKEILLSNKIKESSEKYFVCGHELCHAISHTDIASYYSLNNKTKSKSENEANHFSTVLMKELYIEEYGNQVQNLHTLTNYYGLSKSYYHFLEQEKLISTANTD